MKNRRDLQLLVAVSTIALALLMSTGQAAGQESTEADTEVVDETEQRRLQAPTGSTDVALSVEPRQIVSIDEKGQFFVVDVRLEATWTDHRIQPCKRPEDGSIVHQGESASERLKTDVWWPGFDILHGRGPRETRGLALTLECDGTVRYEERFVTSISQNFENLNKFPFDHHSLTFTVVPFATANANHINFTLDTKEFTTRRIAEGWDSEEWRFELKEQEPPASPSLTTVIEIKRKGRWYIWNIVLPLVGIVGLSWTVFWMHPERLAERMGVSTTSLLTVVAFDFLTSDDLPKLAFTTRLDAFYNVSYLAVILTVLVSIVVSSRADVSVSDDWTLDRVCRVAFPVAYAGFVGLALLGVFSWGERGGERSRTDIRADAAIEAVSPTADAPGSDFEAAFGFSFDDIGDQVEEDLEPGFMLDGTIDVEGEVDVYRFRLARDDVIWVRMTSTAGRDFDPLLLLFDEDQALVTTDDDSAGNLDSLLRFQAPAAGVYYLLAVDLTGQETGKYRLEWFDEFEQTFGFAFDDLADRTVEENFRPGSVRTTRIGAQDEVDVYVLRVSEGDVISVAMTSTGRSDLDPWLVLYGQDGALVAEDDDGGGDLDSLLQFEPPEPGTFYLLALDRTGTETGPYRLEWES